MSSDNGGTFSVVTNTLYVHPFQLIANRPMAGLMVRVSSGAGRSAHWVSIVVGHRDCRLICCRAEPSAHQRVGLATITFSAWYPPGWYFMACVSDNTVTFNAVSVIPGASVLGSDSNNQNISFLSVANGSITLPSPFSGTTTNVSHSTSFPAVSVLLA